MQAMDITYRQDIFAGRTAGRRHQGMRPSPTSWRRWAPGWWRWAWGRAHAGRLGATRQADVTRQREVDEALADFDRLDILFNCAGIIKRGQEHDPDVFQQVLDVNLTGTMGLRRRAARAEGGAAASSRRPC